MMNSRVRRIPARGRASSRPLVWKWYAENGSWRYERTIEDTWKVSTSSWVSASTRSAPRRSLSLKTSSM